MTKVSRTPCDSTPTTLSPFVRADELWIEPREVVVDGILLLLLWSLDRTNTSQLCLLRMPVDASTYRRVHARPQLLFQADAALYAVA